MRTRLQLSEIQKKQQLLQQRMKGHEGPELGIAMLFEGVFLLLRKGAPDGAVREFLEKAISQYRGRIARPTAGQVKLVDGNRSH